jgi:hypothetical protein
VVVLGYGEFVAAWQESEAKEACHEAERRWHGALAAGSMAVPMAREETERRGQGETKSKARGEERGMRW